MYDKENSYSAHTNQPWRIDTFKAGVVNTDDRVEPESAAVGDDTTGDWFRRDINQLEKELGRVCKVRKLSVNESKSELESVWEWKDSWRGREF